MPRDSLQQLWHALNGLALNIQRCELGEITQTLVHDVFNLNTHNKKVQERLCVDLFANPLDALQYAVSYEEEVKRQRPMGTSAAESPKAIKSEPVFAVDKTNRREYYRCEAEIFTLEHLKKCPARNRQCEFCSIMGHLKNAVTRNIRYVKETCNKE